MPRRDAAPIGAPCWVDVCTSDPERAESFYSQIFGWTAKSAGEEYGGYVNFLKDGVPVAGLMGNDGEGGMADLWSVYLSTHDADTTVGAVVAHGGGVLLAAMDVMDQGRMAMVTDCGQAGIGVWQPGRHQGFGILGEPGAPAWFELHTRDYDASVEFYRNVFGWDTHVASDVPELRYTTLGQGEGQLAGIMDASAFLPEGVPATWSVYFAVEDTDAALAQIVDLGGSIVQPAEDTPFGRLAGAGDPTRARFKLITLP